MRKTRRNEWRDIRLIVRRVPFHRFHGFEYVWRKHLATTEKVYLDVVCLHIVAGRRRWISCGLWRRGSSR